MKVITTKWLDQNKGDTDNPNYRARLVGREIAHDKRDDLFAATPPLESIRMIISICASNQSSGSPGSNFIMMSNDVKRAYFEAPASRPIYIKIPAEDWAEGDENNVAQLNLSLYGTRDAAQNWTKAYTEFLESVGFQKGLASPCNFHHPARRISLTVHGDDFTSTGTPAALHWLDSQLRSRFDMKTEKLGPGDGCKREVRILNRVLTWTQDGITYEADQRHAELIVDGMGVSKPVTTPGSREDAQSAGPPNVDQENWAKHSTLVARDVKGVKVHAVEDQYELVGASTVVVEDDGTGEQGLELGPEEAKQFRALAARANYLSQDRPDIQYPVKEIARRMSRPTERDWRLLKRLARYLLGKPRAVVMYHWQEPISMLDVYTDSDWAGCKTSCRSTSGGVIQLGWHFIKGWSSTQTVLAMSSAEAELYALVKGASQTLGLISLARDLGQRVDGTVHSDASAALGIVNRDGLGKLRHINVQYLWIQNRANLGDVKVQKIPGVDNPADLFTKNLPALDIEKFCEALSLERTETRADTAPALHAVAEQGQEVTDAELVVEHRHPRRSLFMPSRVDGEHPKQALTGYRETHAVDVLTGKTTVVRDNWGGRGEAEKKLGFLWTGYTKFIRAGEFEKRSLPET